MRWTFLALALLAPSAVGQEKSASSVSDIIACVRMAQCPNALASTVSWADMGGIPVQIVTDRGVTYALSAARDTDALSIFVTADNERPQGRLITVGAHGRVLSAELGRQPGEQFPMRMTPEQQAQRRKLRQAYRSSEHPSQIGTWGEEHRTFWQQQADAAIAAIRRQFAAPASQAQARPVASPDSLSQIRGCLQRADCRNMQAGSVSNWSDAASLRGTSVFTGMSFEDAGWTYELFLTGPTTLPRDVSIILTAPGENRSSQLLILDSTLQLIQGELRLEAGGASQAPAARRAFVVAARSPTGSNVGEEFKPFWQKQTDQALAAIRRALSK